MKKNHFTMENCLRTAGIIILAVLFVYLPFDHGGFYPRSLAVLCFICFFFISAKNLFLRWENYPKPVAVAFMIFICLLLLSALFSTDRDLSFREFFLVLSGAAGFIMGFFLRGHKKIFMKAVYYAGAVFIFNCIMGIVYFMINTKAEPRAYGRFFQPNALAGYIVLFLPLFISMMLVERGFKKMMFWGGGSMLGCVVLYLTHSRGALVAFLIALPFIYAVLKKQVKPFYFAGALTGLTLTCLVVVFVLQAGRAGFAPMENPKPMSVNQKGDQKARNLLARFDFWEASIKIASKHPLLGTGPGTFRYQYPAFQKRQDFYSRYVHNYYLSMASQAGIPALLAFLVIVYFIAERIKISVSEISDESAAAARGLGIGLLAVLIHVFVDVDFYFAAITFSFWTIAGFLAGAGKAESPGVPGKGRAWISLLILFLVFPPVTAYLSDSALASGSHLLKKQEPEAAMVLFEKSFRLNPLSAEAPRKISECCFQLKRYEESLIWINRAISRSPYRAFLYMQRGLLYMALGKNDSGMEDLIRAVELDPFNHPSVYEYLEEFHSEAGGNTPVEQKYRAIMKNRRAVMPEND